MAYEVTRDSTLGTSAGGDLLVWLRLMFSLGKAGSGTYFAGWTGSGSILRLTSGQSRTHRLYPDPETLSRWNIFASTGRH